MDIVVVGMLMFMETDDVLILLPFGILLFLLRSVLVLPVQVDEVGDREIGG